MNKIKIPKQITILGRTIKVQELSKEEIDKISMGAQGSYNYKEKRIVILKTLDHTEKILTLMHEVHHVISFIGGFSQIEDKDIFEVRAELYAGGFLDLLRYICK
jgi:Zn-dependent peptidase ImmA (M78 family)